MKANKTLDQVATVLLIVGGINWGIVGLFEKDAVGEIFGYTSDITRLVFIAVGLATVYLLVTRLSGKKA